jgi:hypothetical protein
MWTARFALFANPTLCERSLLLNVCGRDVTVDVDGEPKTCGMRMWWLLIGARSLYFGRSVGFG